MKPIGPLMREHRLIERLVQLLEGELRWMDEEKTVEPGFIEVAVDFFRTYADRTHHGKEEDILFKQLAEKKLTPELKKIMDELIGEHAQARKMVSTLSRAGAEYRQGESGAMGEIKALLKELAGFYPRHIEKEDKHFFYPVMEYFTKGEQDSMLQEFWEFDRRMIHEKYQKVVEVLGD